MTRFGTRFGLTLLAGAALVFAVACEDEEDPTPSPTSTATVETTATAEATEPATATATAEPTETAEATAEATATPDDDGDVGTPLGRQVGGATCDSLYPDGLEVGQEVEDVFICISDPAPGDSVGDSIEVSGWQAGSFEQNVIVEVRDADGTVLVRTPTTANAPELGLIAGEWSVTVELTEAAATETGVLAAYTESARDGSLDFGGEFEVTFE
jgi:hypothetical protein